MSIECLTILCDFFIRGSYVFVAWYLIKRIMDNAESSNESETNVKLNSDGVEVNSKCEKHTRKKKSAASNKKGEKNKSK